MASAGPSNSTNVPIGVSSSSIFSSLAQRCDSGRRNVVRYFSYRKKMRIPNPSRTFASESPSETCVSISSPTLCCSPRFPPEEPSAGPLNVSVTSGFPFCSRTRLPSRVSVRIRSICSRFASVPSAASNRTLYSWTRPVPRAACFAFIFLSARCNPSLSAIRSLISVSCAIFFAPLAVRFLPTATSASIADTLDSISRGHPTPRPNMRHMSPEAHVAISTASSQASAERAPQPPVARSHPIEHVLHGDRRIDHYAWLREKQDPAVLAYLHAENAYTDAILRHTEPFQEKLYQEMLGRILQTDLSVPYRLRGYLYFTRTEEGKQYPIHCRRLDTENSPEEILLDLNALAEGHSFLGLGVFTVSDNNHLLAYSLDTTGFRQYTLELKDLRNGTTLPERIERVTSATWAADNRTLFYTIEDETTKRSHRLYRHVLGSN